MKIKALVLYDTNHNPYIIYNEQKYYLINNIFKKDYPEFTIEKVEYQPLDTYIYIKEKHSYDKSRS